MAISKKSNPSAGLKRLKTANEPYPTAIEQLLNVMSRLRAPDGCPWDLEQTHQSIIFHGVEEIYELMDAIDSQDDREMMEELGDLLLQVVFHCQMAQERGAFNFNQVTQNLVDKLIRRHPHVFGESKVRSISGIWDQWDKIKKSEKAGTENERKSALDGIPRHLPALMKAEKLIKKARKANLVFLNKEHLNDSFPMSPVQSCKTKKHSIKQSQFAAFLFEIVSWAQQQGWSPEELLRNEIVKREKAFRKIEAKGSAKNVEK